MRLRDKQVTKWVWFSVLAYSWICISLHGHSSRLFSDDILVLKSAMHGFLSSVLTVFHLLIWCLNCEVHLWLKRKPEESIFRAYIEGLLLEDYISEKCQTWVIWTDGQSLSRHSFWCDTCADAMILREVMLWKIQRQKVIFCDFFEFLEQKGHFSITCCAERICFWDWAWCSVF